MIVEWLCPFQILWEQDSDAKSTLTELHCIFLEGLLDLKLLLGYPYLSSKNDGVAHSQDYLIALHSCSQVGFKFRRAVNYLPKRLKGSVEQSVKFKLFFQKRCQNEMDFCPTEEGCSPLPLPFLCS